jgi:hypothetical protein
MGRIIVIILALSAVIYGVNGLTEEIENLVNLQDNIHKVIGE